VTALGRSLVLRFDGSVRYGPNNADPRAAAIGYVVEETEPVLEGCREVSAFVSSTHVEFRALVAGARAAAPARERAGRTVLRPLAEPEPLSVAATADGWEVTGGKVDRWVARTDFGNAEAVRALQRTLVRAGVEDALVAAGAVRGDTVILGEVAFDFDPEMPDAQEAGDADAQSDPDDFDEPDTAAPAGPVEDGPAGDGEPASGRGAATR